MGPCSTPEELERFLHHRLDAPKGDIIAAHLEGCASCQQRLEQITSRPVRQSIQQLSAVREEGWIAGVLERVKAKGPNLPLIKEEDKQNRDRHRAQSLVDEPRQEAKRAEACSSSSTRPCPEIQGFRNIREIGRGGMGVVYEAEEQNLSRRVALKILPANALEDPQQIRRFEREAKAAGRLHHTNIVPVFGVGQSQGNHYYVMQYIDGLGLDVVVDELRRLQQMGSNRHDTEVHELNEELNRSASNADGTIRNTIAEVARSVARGSLTASRSSPLEQTASDTELLDSEMIPSPGALANCPRSDASSTMLSSSSELSTHSHFGRAYFNCVASIGVQATEALE
jgi:Protein kinase domain